MSLYKQQLEAARLCAEMRADHQARRIFDDPNPHTILRVPPRHGKRQIEELFRQAHRGVAIGAGDREFLRRHLGEWAWIDEPAGNAK